LKEKAMKWSPLASVIILIVTHAGMVCSRANDSESQSLPSENPLDLKQRAKDKLEARHANIGELKRARLEAARKWRDTRYKEFLAGRGTLIFLHEAAFCALRSQLAVCTNRAETIAALEDYWHLMRMIEEVNRARNEAGRLPDKDYRQSTYFRIDAEQRLRAARGQK